MLKYRMITPNMIIWAFNGALSAASKEMDRHLKRRLDECVEWKELIIFVVFHSTVSLAELIHCN
jgi:hypothetical protein